MELKGFVKTLAVTNNHFKLTEEEWCELERIRDMFKDCYIFTKKVQSNQMTVSDFYGEWVDLKIKLKKINSFELVDQLLYYMEQREAKFMESPVAVSALFLDTRYRVLLNEKPMSSQMAMNHLACLWKRIWDLKSTESAPPDGANLLPVNNTTNESDFERYLDSLESNESLRPNLPILEDVITKFIQFDVESKAKKRDVLSSHPMDYWEANKAKKPELYEIAKIVFAVASTEVSVERNFSALTFILNKYRCSLTDEMLEEILFIRLNKSMFDAAILK